MGDTEQAAIDALRAAGLEAEARAVEQLRGRHKETMDAYHAGQRASYKNGRADALGDCQTRISDLLGVLQMVDDNQRVDDGEDRKAWRGSFVVSEVRRVLGDASEHWSDCATSNGPAYPLGPCDCGATPISNLSKVMQPKMLGPGHMTDAERLEATRRFRGD